MTGVRPPLMILCAFLVGCSAPTAAPSASPEPTLAQSSADQPWQPVEPAGEQGRFDGLWRMKVDREPLVAAGVREADAQRNVGVWTFDIDAPALGLTATNGTSCAGTVAAAGDLMTIAFGDGPTCGGAVTVLVIRDGDRMRWIQSRAPDPSLDGFFDALFADGLRRIAD